MTRAEVGQGVHNGIKTCFDSVTLRYQPIYGDPLHKHTAEHPTMANSDFEPAATFSGSRSGKEYKMGPEVRR